MKRSVFCLSFLSILVLLNSPQLLAQSSDATEARNQAYRLQQSGKLAEAVEQYEEAIRLDPSYVTPHNDLGILHEEMNRPDLAIVEYMEALDIDPNYAGVYTNLAALYENQGDLPNSLAFWQKRSQMGSLENPWRKQAEEKVQEIGAALARSSGSQTSSYGTGETFISEAEKGESISGSNKKRIRELSSQAKKDIRDYRYTDALQKLSQAKSLGGDPIKLNKIIDKAREREIDFDIARATVEGNLYKQSKFIEVQNAWFPPLPEPDAGQVKDGLLSSLEAKTPARLILEKKANQIIPSIDFDDGRLKDVVEYLALSNDINIVIDEQVVDDASGVTIHLKNIPLIEALDIILRTKGLKYRFEDNIIWITTGEKLAEEDLTVQVYDVQDLVGKLHDFPSQPFDIEAIINDKSEKEEEE